MKIFNVILLVLLINPAIADDSFSLYQKSGGYEKSGGYDRSGGYEKSTDGYMASEGYNQSIHGYEKSEGGYTPFDKFSGVGSSQISNRLVEEKYDQQVIKARQTKGQWIAERHQNEGTSSRIRSTMQETGGNEDLID